MTTLFFCGVRFYVGNDYDGYYNYFQIIRTYPGLAWVIVEPGFGALNRLFSFSPIGYTYVLFVSSAITFFITYYLLAKQNILKLGVFAIYTLGFLIIANDQVRQMIAVPIFLYAVRYIDEKKPLKYLILIAIATTFHYSAAVCALVYLIRYIKVNKNWVIALLCIAFLVKLSGVVDGFMHNMTKLLIFFNETYAEKSTVESYYSGATFGVQLLYFWLISMITFVSIPKAKFDNIYVRIFSFGASFYVLFWGQLLFERGSLYLFEALMIAFPKALQQKKILGKLAVIACALYFMLQSLFAMEKNGAVPYRTIYHENLVNPRYDRNSQ